MCHMFIQPELQWRLWSYQFGFHQQSILHLSYGGSTFLTTLNIVLNSV
jgi:hypothetical protein